MPSKPKDEQVRIFVEFTDLESAYRAVKTFNNLTYDDRLLRADFYEADQYYAYKFDDEI